MGMKICSLSSSSRGNSTFVSTGKTCLLVDAGLSAKNIEEKMAQINMIPEMLKAILVTHEHIDHIKSVGTLVRKYNLPVYINEKTLAKATKKIGEISQNLIRLFNTDEDFFIDDLQVEPIAIPHDAADPVAFRLFFQGKSISIATDIGKCGKKLIKRFIGSDFMLIESNHDESRLWENPKYPFTTKQRIAGLKGHLSNIACAEAIAHLIEGGTKHFLLGHLSPENNDITCAFEQIQTYLMGREQKFDKDYYLYPTWENKISGVYSVD